jgi:peptidoglycan/LPS O-acetylase OafA/YrhL
MRERPRGWFRQPQSDRPGLIVYYIQSRLGRTLSHAGALLAAPEEIVSGMPDPDSPSFVHPAAPDPGPINRVFYPALDGLRALAFLMVFGQHYFNLSWGWAGVDIFFVLSGFLITGILYDTKDHAHRVANFYIRRTLRIFPLYYATLLAVLLTLPLFHWRLNATWLIWPAYLGNFARFLHPYTADSPLQLLADAQPLSRTIHGLRLYLGHFWSLCVEEQFYLIWPWIVFWIKHRKRLLALCLAVVILTPIARIVASHHLPAFMLDGEILYRATFFRADSLLLGGALALITRGGHAHALYRTARVVFLLCTATLALWLAFNPYARTLRLNIYPDWKFTWGLSFIDLFAAALIVLATQPRSWTSRIFSPAPLRWIGRISYGAYVLHDIPKAFYYKAVKHLPGSSTTNASILGLLCTLLLAWLSFRFFESPFIRLKERWTR